MRKVLLALAVLVGGLGATGGTAFAAAPPEWDHVEAWATGSDGMRGDIRWSSYRAGSGTIRVHNNLRDGSCVALRYRVMVNSSYGPWVWVGSVCFNAYGDFPVSVSRSSNIQAWQFKVTHVDWGNSAYDTNQPGGA
jgi:hypothetical protein